MANSSLQGKYFTCPDNIIEGLKKALSEFSGDKKTKGYERANNIINNSKITYEQLKRIKNYFEAYSGDINDAEYKLNGGKLMEKWVNNILETARKSIKNVKKTQKDSGMQNKFKKYHHKDKDNVNIGKVRIPKIAKSSKNNYLMNNDMVYEEINKIKYLIEYLENK